MVLFDNIMEYSNDIYRNIASTKPTQNLFDDLSEDPKNWDAANHLDIVTHKPTVNNAVIQRGFDYSENMFIDYPFKNLTSSRFSDGSIGCWYASEDLETSIYETAYHFHKGVVDSIDAYIDEKEVIADRRVALVSCNGLAINLSEKSKDFPWLVDPNNYSKCQEIGKRIAEEGHPLLRASSSRKKNGVNMVAFNSSVLSNVMEHCYLKYILTIKTQEIDIIRAGETLFTISA